MKARILIVDDNLEMARMLADDVTDHGLQAVALSSGKKAIELVKREAFDLVVTDLRMPDADGLQVLAASRAAAPERPVIVMTAYSAIDTAVEAIRSGAYHYITKPFKSSELILFVDRALSEIAVRNEAKEVKRLREELKRKGALGPLVAKSAAMRAVVDVVDRVARSSVPVLLTGETGTGKSAVARTIHEASDRAGRAFVTVNCAALPEQLLESELFGHVKGAFTNAHAARSGLFVEADGGTLLLDEIGEMALTVQAKLLHVLERGLVRPVGAEREQPVDVRIIAATNRNLKEATSKGQFREDLLFRLDVVTLELPPLRARREDIVPLVADFLADAKRRHPTSPVERIPPDVVEAFAVSRWPGNVRELKHIVERLIVLGRQKDASLKDVPASAHSDEPVAVFTGEIMPIRRLQRLYAQWALAQLGGQKLRTADRLGVDVKTLGRWLSDTADEREGEDKG